MNKWQKFELGELCDFIKGETGIAKAPAGPYPLVTTGAERKTCATYQFDTKAVCLPTISSAGHGKKSLNYIHYQEGKFALGTILVALIPKDENQLNAKYLHTYLFHYKDLLIVPLQKGAANVSLPIKEVKKIKIPVPPISEQLKLKNLLQNIDSDYSNFLKENGNQIILLNQLRQAILQEAVEGKLTAEWRKQNPELISGENHAARLLEKINAEKEQLIKEGKIKKQKALPPISDDEKPFELPEGWVWCRLGELIYKFSTGPFGTMLHKSDYVQNGIPLINPMNIVANKIIANQKMMVGETTKKRLSRYILDLNDVVLARRGDLSKCAVITENEKGWLCGTGSFFIRIYNFIDKHFFILGFKSKYLQKELLDKSVGQTMDNLNQSVLKNALFAIPPVAEQKVVVEKVDRIMLKINALEEQVKSRKEQAGQLMQAVLREAFRGD